MKFFNNKFILSKTYSKYYVISILNQKLIIIIIYNENIFSTNDSQQKVWTLDRYSILYPKRKKKNYNIKFFLLWL